ncbi:CHAT domain-containing protein [Actinoplanes sp. CA-051413]|uniref:CHAT domain-containing protein n=1 Tax=Actinoplanes sp. CA-051413 TaxID=3239899 RepID=UPI003D97793D
MERYDLEIFKQTTDRSELRFTRDGKVEKRGLDQAAVEALVAAVAQHYSEGSPARRVFGSALLRDLGERLYRFLDGDERWLSNVSEDPRGVALRILTAEERLRHLPWELLARDGAYLAASRQRPLLPIRASSRVATLGDSVTVHNRPLRVLFMATSPEGTEPVLNYEAEEARILSATANTGTELVVEESGTLEGLRFTAESYGAGYFDVLHLSGHATIDGQPRFLVENELGGRVLASADDIAQAMFGQWPRLVFVSGCLTAGAPGEGTFPSMSESLVSAGAPMVLGWALPVGDVSASVFAAHLYQFLAGGKPLDLSVVLARHQLFAVQNSSWHLLRVYADASPLTPVVTPLNTSGRERIRVRHAADEFLDQQTHLSRVASRADFVGRRRLIQRCLRILKQPLGSPGSAQALVLQGMGGLGKSTLASRLLERMPTHQRVVWFGRVDITKFRELTSMVAFETMADRDDAAAVLARDDVDLTERLKYLFRGPLGRISCLFVFDDFEDGNLDERDGGHVLSGEMAPILAALLKAIDDTNSLSRVIITSRYRFPQPAGTTMQLVPLETFTKVEQTKKIANLPNLRPQSPVDTTVKARAIAAASGNPRLLDWLDKIIADTGLDVPALIAAIEDKAAEFRESIFAEKLLGTQPIELQTMLARLNVVELPVPLATVHAVHDHPDADRHIERAAQLGLLEEGLDPETGEPRYYVSNVLRPLFERLLTADDHQQACAAAARSLYQIWVVNDRPGDPAPL